MQSGSPDLIRLEMANKTVTGVLNSSKIVLCPPCHLKNKWSQIPSFNIHLRLYILKKLLSILTLSIPCYYLFFVNQSNFPLGVAKLFS